MLQQMTDKGKNIKNLIWDRGTRLQCDNSHDDAIDTTIFKS